MNYETHSNQKRGGSTPDDQIKRGSSNLITCIDCKQQNPFPVEVAMKGLAVQPAILADDEVLDIILAAHFEDHVGMLCESAAKAVCRSLVLAADKTGCPADALYNTSLDLKMRFKRPTADDFENGDAFFAEEEQ